MDNTQELAQYDLAIWLGNPSIGRKEQPVMLLESIANGRRWVVETVSGGRTAARAEELEKFELEEEHAFDAVHMPG